jgi:poly(3-hydroxybutyrate) depolymerase
VAVGFSNGAHMVHLLGCRLADRISAIVPIGGTLSIESECNPAQPITVLEFHDAKDPVNSYAGGRIGIHHAAWMQPVTKGIGDWAARDKCHTPSTQARYPATGAPAIFYADDFPGCAAGTIVRLYTLYNGTHSWPQTPDVDALIGELAKGQLK